MTEQQDAVERVLKALISGELTRDGLTARRISAFLGQSTMGLYHHFGSLDGFLLRPVEDTRVLFAGLHGLAVLTLSGRTNLGDAERSGEALARESARRLVAAILLPRASGHRT
ncbi:hypothetical protein F0U61_36265 [Archangium violaceum]|uniref:hypothetical protein n=1 Tax=Archangium violaceum TaxID=83451 RepID=UPI002B28805D|nr:hypothetical protein F0U61_36265 [Archangium violaceum]